MSEGFDVIIQVTPQMMHHWGWLLAFGIVLVLLGVAAIVKSTTSTVVSMVFFGWLLVFAAIAEFVNAFMVGHWAGFFQHLLAAILFAAIGILMVTRPATSAEAWTLVMSIFFIIGGSYQLITALWTHLHGWGWQAFSGILSIVMGALIMAQWPLSGLWVIGLCVGIELVIYGCAWIKTALELRKM